MLLYALVLNFIFHITDWAMYPNLIAFVIISTVELTCNFSKICCKWFDTVRSLIKSCSAISRRLTPDATNSRTFLSPSVSSSINTSSRGKCVAPSLMVNKINDHGKLIQHTNNLSWEICAFRIFHPHSFSNIVLSFPNEFKVTILKYFWINQRLTPMKVPAVALFQGNYIAGAFR